MSAVRTRSSRSRYFTRYSPRDRRGISLVLVGFALIVLVGFVSLAVDVGRLRLANAQLQTASDAAARAGAWSLPYNPKVTDATQDVINEAVTASLANPVINQSSTPDTNHFDRQDAGVVPDTTKDIRFGVWNPVLHSFTVITGTGRVGNDPRRGANALRVQVLRTAQRHSPVKLIFAPILGVFTKDAGETATAYIDGGPVGGYGFVGLDSVSSNGNKATLYGGVASDGNINLINGDVRNTTTTIGEARPGMPDASGNYSVTQGPNSNVLGSTAPLNYKLAPSYPPVTSVPPNVTTQIPKDYILTNGGSDAAHAFPYFGTIGKHTNLTIYGYVKLYITKSFDLKDIDSITWKNPTTPSAARLEIIMTGTAPQVSYVGTYGNTDFYAHIYAPQCDVELGGGANFYGWAIGKTLSFQGTSTFTYDGTRDPPTPGTYALHLVQ
jgi:Flp pilus assembly protein TadG